MPIVLDKSIADGFEIVTDEEAFLMAREVCRKEGLLCGMLLLRNIYMCLRLQMKN